MELVKVLGDASPHLSRDLHTPFAVSKNQQQGKMDVEEGADKTGR